MQRKFLLSPFFCFMIQIMIGQEGIKITQNIPFVLGTIIEIESSTLAEKRTLNIYLPEDYNKKDTIHYLVNNI